MVGDVDHCFRIFQNWHTPELVMWTSYAYLTIRNNKNVDRKGVKLISLHLRPQLKIDTIKIHISVLIQKRYVSKAK